MGTAPTASTPAGARLNWRRATLVARVAETPRVMSLVLAVPEWPGHRAGQHVDVRLTAEDGYQAERSYSIASAPEEARVTLTVETLDDGEVSPYLTGELQVGEPLELRGPIGSYFVWDDALRAPALLVGGGSGVVPLMAMIRHRAARGLLVPTRLLYSVRAPADAIYHAELGRLAAAAGGLEVVYTYTRSAPDGWTGYRRRLDAAMLAEVGWPATGAPLAFICGPTRFVETAADGLRGLGYAAARIKTERFGATGG